MKYLKLTTETSPVNPGDEHPYTYYNQDINKVWIFLALRWILENGYWEMNKYWDSSSRWNYYGPAANVAV